MVFHHIPARKHPAGAVPPEGRPGILLLNLGTPDDTGYRAVRRYLSEFLSDRRVIEGSPVLWQPILQGVVLTVRPGKSGKAYERIWDKDKNESPLRGYTRGQADGLRARFAAEDVPVVWGMRYGTPSVAAGVQDLLEQGCDRILVMPLYPQYSATTTATANDQLFRALMQLRNQPALRTLPAFPDDATYIEALANSVRKTMAELAAPPQMLVASFHGLPQEYVDKGDSYLADCQRTVKALREAVGMDEATLPLTFQSRFGPTKWLEPYTAPFIAGLPEKGVKLIAVITPGFMTDCIETLDEIGNEVCEDFMKAGGEEFTLIPCLNDSVEAIDVLEQLARQELAGWL
ncbi:ferrochelatase [Acetobacter orleanensis]|uniref:Ferrochelatase n=1 Tax=Acetobacter orleanensis TaxID=104099 RepID=A0A4Y3TN72_9PROT|nr:ferrochelatase [Acetobacter orleanensis]KXV62672.1 ferrochelatase [Acetobacter orleanensis]PCD79184.1 ferrochelatase [Acetobacter orleanensis]GAN68627.1 ferrochelatase [Acetobacter orleanensis JCM 7639]GBR27776.1 ferrochelatase [Acetobacter orleanensis NRIC 0473]GEB83258.1 ferrochelatase [Acetobacter orleanensis]